MHLRRLAAPGLLFLLALGAVALRAEDREDPVAPDAPARERPAAPLPDFAHKGIAWLVAAQHESGGWGAGSHANQQLRDPAAVKTDPATTSFAALALIRAGHTPVAGEHRGAVRKAIAYVIGAIEKADDDGPRITDLTGTQPQAKLGPLVDTAFAVQLLSRAAPLLPADDALKARADAALAKALRKLQTSQQADGSWGARGGWAPVLQSSVATNALEGARLAGGTVDRDVLTKARGYQVRNLDPKTGKADAGAAAGVELYAWAGAGRAAAGPAAAAEKLVREAKERGDLEADAEVDEVTLRRLDVPAGEARVLVTAVQTIGAQQARLDDERLLQGFGNNGGEEYLSYLMASETLVLRGGEKWDAWSKRMRELFARVQTADGSWTGHHCITSPVFCTAAVLQTLAVERDVAYLEAIARQDAEAAGDGAAREEADDTGADDAQDVSDGGGDAR